MTLDGDRLVEAATARLGIDLKALVAGCSIWAHPDMFAALRRLNGLGVWYPGRRRARKGEKVGDVVDGVTLDDNTAGNLAIKMAVFGAHAGVKRFHACHVWPATCYDARYHTCIANLVLIPAAVAGLSDHDEGVAAALRFRSWELFGWKPEEADVPTPPQGYPPPEAWLPPLLPTDRALKALARLDADRMKP